MSLFELLFCYGVTFGLMNKTLWLQNRSSYLGKLFECSYCTGFHAGWIIYLTKLINTEMQFNIIGLIYFCFASSAFCYIADCICEYLESK